MKETKDQQVESVTHVEHSHDGAITNCKQCAALIEPGSICWNCNTQN